MIFPRIFSDSTGETHFGEFEVEANAGQLMAQVPSLLISNPVPSSAIYFLATKITNEFSDPVYHPSPERLLVIQLQGNAELMTSDGATKIFRPGDVVLMEDTTGKGHRTTISGDYFLSAMVKLEHLQIVN